MGHACYRALLIGNSTFPADANNLQTLEGPVNDITLLRGALTDARTGLFDADNVRILPERTSAEILMELEQFFGAARRDDVLLLYYSGHGLLNERGQLFLCARDTRTDLLKSTSVSSMAVNMMFDESAARTTVIVLDCCHSGAFKGGALPDSLKGTGRFVMTSCRSGQLANDADRRNGTSLFTQHLVEGLTGDVSDSNGDGYVDVGEVFDFVSTRLREEGRQIPQRDFSGDGDLAIARRPAPSTPSTGASPPPAPAPERRRVGVVETELDFGTLTAGRPSPRHRVRVDGGATVVEADPWVHVDPVPDGVVIAVDTSSAGRLSGSVRLRSGDEHLHVSVRAVIEPPVPVTEPLPPIPPVPAPEPPRNRSPVALIAAAVVGGLVVLGLIGLALGNGGGGGDDVVDGVDDGNRTTAVIVDSRAMWTDVGIGVQAGQVIEIIATGEVDTATDQPGRTSPPDGIAGEEDRPFNAVRGVAHGALIGRIGEGGAPFLVGSHAAFTADRSGRLYLGVNDAGVENNEGSYDATVTLVAT